VIEEATPSTTRKDQVVQDLSGYDYYGSEVVYHILIGLLVVQGELLNTESVVRYLPMVRVHQALISPKGSTVGIHATSPSVNIQSCHGTVDMTVTSVIILGIGSTR
jgi:hypothetical protein